MNVEVHSLYNEIVSNINKSLPITIPAYQNHTAVHNNTVQDFDSVLDDYIASLRTDNLSSLSDLEISDAIEQAISAAASLHGIDANLIKAIIKQESNFNPYAVSSAGASGLMQLMPGTARSLGVSDIFDIYENINGGTKYLSQMLSNYGDLSLALAAYNAGPGNVNKYGGIPPFEETQNYVPKVLNYYTQFSGGS